MNDAAGGPGRCMTRSAATDDLPPLLGKSRGVTEQLQLADRGHCWFETS